VCPEPRHLVAYLLLEAGKDGYSHDHHCQPKGDADDCNGIDGARKCSATVTVLNQTAGYEGSDRHPDKIKN